MTVDPTPDMGEGDAARGSEHAPLVRVRSDRVVLAGLGLWTLALLVVAAVPALRTGERDWWPWACVTGLVLGGLGWVYLRRGRGNAADADAPVPVPTSVTRRQSRS